MVKLIARLGRRARFLLLCAVLTGAAFVLTLLPICFNFNRLRFGGVSCVRSARRRGAIHAKVFKHECPLPEALGKPIFRSMSAHYLTGAIIQ